MWPGARGAQVAAEQVRNVRRDVVAGLARHDLLDQLRRSDLLHPDLAAREPRAELDGAVERQPPSHANHCRHVREHQQASEHEAEASVAKGVDAERAAEFGRFQEDDEGEFADAGVFCST